MPIRSTIASAYVCCLVLFASCGEKQQDHTHFTKTDSLTETYLALQDSVLQSWNTMINDDNRKLESMAYLLHELEVSGGADPALVSSFRERLIQLRRSRYTQKTMWNEDIVTEYDFASNSLITELLSLAESKKEFAYNTTLQKLADHIRTADQRVMLYREQYDHVTQQYNAFLQSNKKYLREIDTDSSLEMKPVFQLAEESEN